MVSYTPQFNPPPWVDFVDTVQAGGSNGFNARFQQIVTEFMTLSQVVSAINTALQPPAPTPHTVTLAPTLAATPAGAPWQQQIASVTVPTVGQPATGYQSAALGFMPVTLPNGAILQSLRVTGSSAGGSLIVTLYSQPLTSGALQPVLVASGILPTAAPAAPFDIPPAPQNGSTVVNNSSNKYFLLAQLTNGNVALAGLGTSLDAFQITYSAT
jgi:hypothetical protein